MRVLLTVLAAGYGAAVAGALIPPAAHRFAVRSGAAPLAGAGAVVCAALAYAVGARPELAVWLLAVPFALLLAVVDRATLRLPDVLTLPLAGGTAALLGVAALLPGAGGSWVGSLLGSVVLAGAYYAFMVFGPRDGLGFGDVKLAIALGVALGWYGWGVLFVGAFAGFLFSAGWGVILILARRAGRKTPLAMGPFMLAGTFAGLLLGGTGG